MIRSKDILFGNSQTGILVGLNYPIKSLKIAISLKTYVYNLPFFCEVYSRTHLTLEYCKLLYGIVTRPFVK